MPRATRRILITAGPTHEPIDAVRYLGNRSSGETGLAVAAEAARRAWAVRILLGPTPRAPTDSRIAVHRFRTADDLEQLLHRHFHEADVLVMAAAVSDFRPGVSAEQLGRKLRRTDAGLTLDLERTPDLLAACAERRQPGQFLVGFALEEQGDLDASARDKLVGKGLDLLVANPLETMEATTIRATAYEPAQGGARVAASTPGTVSKAEFAVWLMDLIEERATRGHDAEGSASNP